MLGMLFMANLVSAADGTADRPRPDGTADKPVVSTTPSTATPIGKIQNPLNVDSIEDVILLLVDILIYIGVCFAILAIIWVGFQFVLAQGNPEKIKDAKRWFFYIIIGLAILISAKVIIEVVENTLVGAGVVNENAFRNR